jgi:hypothetical protein
MRKIFLVGLVAVAAILMTTGVYAQHHQSGIITGAVSVQADTQFLSMASIQAFSLEHPNTPAGWAMTNHSGQYAMYLAPGSYIFMAVKQGYQVEWWQESAIRDSATSVTLADGDTVTGVNFTLAAVVPPPPPAHGTITGIVLDDSTNAPIYRAEVRAAMNNYMMFTAHTDSLGNYSINVPVGTYYVNANKMGYNTEWWQESVNRDSATAVVVAQDQTVSGINFTLGLFVPPPPPVHGSIAGLITNATTSAPLGHAMVMATMLGNHHYHFNAMTADDGTYIFNYAPTGYYRIEAGKENFVPAQYPDSVYVNGTPVTGINIALTPILLGTLTGVVTNAANSEPIVGAWVNAANMNSPRICQRARTDSTGSYSLSLPVGTYHVEAGARGYSTLRVDSVLVGDFAPTVQNFALATINFGSIAGTVFDTANVPIIGAWVEARMIQGNWRGRARTDSTGQYLIQNVVPGRYILAAHANHNYPTVFSDTVVIANGQAVTGVDFHLLPYVQPNGTIAGVVTDDSTGLPIAEAMVMAFGYNTPGNHRFSFRMTRTLADGTYLLERLAAAPYKVMCMAHAYTGEFYNNKLNWNEADTVMPSATGINFGLAARTSGPRYLGGRILQGNQAVPGAIVILMENGEPIDVAGTYPDGSYEFANIESGNYTISVITPDQGEESVEILFNDIYSQDISVVTSSVDNEIALPTATTLVQNYPNPFNSSTNISFYLANQTSVNLCVYDLLGRKVVTLVNGDLQAGQHTINWNGIDANGTQVATGMYLYVLKADGTTYSKQMLMLK